MNKVVEGRVRLYLIALMVIIMMIGAVGGFMLVEEVKTEGYYFEIEASNEKNLADIKREDNK